LTPGVPAMAAMAAFGLALFITVLVIFSMDVRKRFQGVLLSVGTVLVILQLAAANILVPSINPFDRLAAGGIILGVGLGLALEWEKITTIDPAGRASGTSVRPTAMRSRSGGRHGWSSCWSPRSSCGGSRSRTSRVSCSSSIQSPQVRSC
jgi:hypothetical protein